MAPARKKTAKVSKKHQCSPGRTDSKPETEADNVRHTEVSTDMHKGGQFLSENHNAQAGQERGCYSSVLDAVNSARPIPAKSPVTHDGPGSSGSKDKSSLQSSFDADQAGIRHLYSSYQAGVMDMRHMVGHEIPEHLLLAAEQLSDEEHGQSGHHNLDALQLFPPAMPRSPFAGMGTYKDWGDEAVSQDRRMQREPVIPGRAPPSSSRARALHFGSPRRGQRGMGEKSGNPKQLLEAETDPLWQNTMQGFMTHRPERSWERPPSPVAMPPQASLPAYPPSTRGLNSRSGHSTDPYFSGVMGSQMPPESIGTLGNAFAAALGSGYIPPGGATTALPLGPTKASLSYSSSGYRASKNPPSSEANDNQQAVAGQKCNCKKSRCLKLYCVCFHAGQFCLNCTCTNCSNLPEFGEAVMEIRSQILSKNEDAFKKEVKSKGQDGTISVTKKGCHCKKSNCKKKYCECFQAGLNCGAQCKCENCHNQPGDNQPDPRPPPAQRRAESGRMSAGESEVTLRRPTKAPKRVPFLKQEPERQNSQTTAGSVPSSVSLNPKPSQNSRANVNPKASVPLPALPLSRPPSAMDHSEPIEMSIPLETIPEPLDQKMSTPFSPTTMLCNNQIGYQATGTSLLGKNAQLREEGDLVRPLAAKPLLSDFDQSVKERFLAGDDEAALLTNTESLDRIMSDQDRDIAKAMLDRDLSAHTPLKGLTLLSDHLDSSRVWNPEDLSNGQGGFLELPEGFNIHDLPLALEGTLDGETAWAASRIEDLGEDANVNLDTWINPVGIQPADIPLIPGEMGASPLSKVVNKFEPNDNSLKFFGWAQPSPTVMSLKRKFSETEDIESPPRYPLGESNQMSRDRRVQNHGGADRGPPLATLPSFDPLGGIPALKSQATNRHKPRAIRKHSAAPSSLPTAERAFNNDFLQNLRDEPWLANQENALTQQEGQDDAHMSYVAQLQQAQSLPSSYGLPELAVKREFTGRSPSKSMTAAIGIKSEPGYQDRHSRPRSSQDGRPSPKKVRINRISGTESANGTFYKITSGMTTILSPPKLH